MKKNNKESQLNHQLPRGNRDIRNCASSPSDSNMQPRCALRKPSIAGGMKNCRLLVLSLKTEFNEITYALILNIYHPVREPYENQMLKNRMKAFPK